MAATCYLGAPFAEGLFAALPPVVLSWLAVGGKMLPALGFAILLNQIIQEKWMVFLFIFGWVIASSFGITTTSLVFVAIAFALIYVMARYSGKGAGPAVAAATAASAIEDEEGNYEER